mgnify:CR=1 FL=1
MERIGFFGFLIVGLALAGYGVNGILKRRITVFARGQMPTVCNGSEAVSNGIIYATFGVGFAGFGALMLFASFHV